MPQIEAIAPSAWSCYLMYGETEGMTSEDIRAANNFLDDVLTASPVSCEEYGIARFDGLLTDCSTYLALVD